MRSSTNTPRRGWTLAIVSIGLFMMVLDNLVVNVALPSIRHDLGASIQTLEWTVNAYILAYAVLLLTGAALGDRLGRKRMFIAGIALFTVGSAAAALSPTIGFLIAARATQGVAAAIVTPLTLTLLAEAFPPEQRGLALGVWSGISGIGVALGPLVGGALTQVASWHWIFWVNVPIGIALIPLAASRLVESRGEVKRLDLPGLALVSTGLFGVVYGLVRSQSLGWSQLRGGRQPGRRDRAARGVHLAGAPHLRADAADELLRQPQLRRDQRGLDRDVLRDVRLDLLPEPVPPERPAQLAAAGRRQAAGLDRRRDGRLAGGGLHVRALRQPVVHGRRARPPGGRARACWRRWPASTRPTRAW